MITKSEQLEICRTCSGQRCNECSDNAIVMRIQNNLRSVRNIGHSNNYENWFGKAPCQACGDKLAGDRYSLIATNNKNGEPVELDVCVDCYGYLMT